MAEAEDEDYHFYGTPLEDEQEGRAGTYRRPAKDPAQLRNLPIWKQEATDEQGRKRFHGAFTGGFSAGYYNSVGSAEGFQPATFKSSRSSRQAVVQQSVEDFLDEDEREERNRTVLTVKEDYDTFGTMAAHTALSVAQREAQQRPSLIPGLIIDELLPVANGVGMRLLQKLGWRPGRGVGTAAPSRQAEAAGSKWGSVAGVSLENTPLYVLEPKQDLHGLGYDPFDGAEDFRQAAKRRKVAERGGGEAAATAAEAAAGGAAAAASKDCGAGGAAAQRRGRIAFGTGALEETDTYGYMEDYVDEEYAEPRQGHPGGSGTGWQGPKALTGAAVGALGSSGVGGRGGGVARNWERLALSYEVVSEGDSDGNGTGGHARPGRRRRPLLLLEAGSKGAPPPLLQARGHGRAPDSFILGFRPSRSSSASGVVVSDYFPPPEVPAEFNGRHVFPPGLRAGGLRLTLVAAAAAGGAGGCAGSSAVQQQQQQHHTGGGGIGAPPPPPEVHPPADPGLRREIEVLAAMVARSGSTLEQIARKQAAAAATGAAGAGAAAAAGGCGEAVSGRDAITVAKGGGRSKYSFFITGEGLPYYLWRLHKIQTALAAVNAGPQHPAPPAAATAVSAGPATATADAAARSAAHRPAGGRQDTLTVEQRMAMLGEQPLPAATTIAAAAAAVAAAGSTATTAVAAIAITRPQVAEADRQHLQALLSNNFVRGETQDLSTDSVPQTSQAGLRLGGKQAAAAAAAAAAFLSRFTGGSSSETAILQADGPGGLQQQHKAGKDRDGGKLVVASKAIPLEPVRSVEDWRPEALLCKRFNVPDPYKGKPPPQQAPRFRTDLLALTETSNLPISTTTAAMAVGAPGLSQRGAARTVGPPPVLPPPPLPLPADLVSGNVATAPAAFVAAMSLVPSSCHVSNVPLPPPQPPPRPGISEQHHTLSQGTLTAPPLPPGGPQPPLPTQAASAPLSLQPGLSPSNLQSGGHSAADAASAFLSAFGQSIFAPGDGGADAAAPAAPPPRPPLPPQPGPVPAASWWASSLHAQPLPPPPSGPGSAPVPGVPLHDVQAVGPVQAAAQQQQQQQPQPAQDEDLAFVPLDKPLDLFAAIFEAGSDDAEEGEEEQEENAGNKEQQEEVGATTPEPRRAGGEAVGGSLSGSAAEGENGGAAGSPAKSLAEALMRAQEVSAKRAQEARESRQAAALQQQLLTGGAPAVLSRGAAVAAAGDAAQVVGGILGPVDSEVQERIRAALSLFQSHHRYKDRSKDRKKKDKDKKKRREKDKKGKRDNKRKDKDRGRHRERDGDGDRKLAGKRRRKERGSEKKAKKVRNEEEERRPGKRGKKRRGERRGEERGRRTAAEETDDEREGGRKRSRRSSSRSSDEEDRVRLRGDSDAPSGANQLPGGPLAAAAAALFPGGARKGTLEDWQFCQGRGVGAGGGLPSRSATSSTDSSEDGKDGSSSGSSIAESDSGSESQ